MTTPVGGKIMNKYKMFSKLWFPALLLVAFFAGCASNDPEALPNPDTIRPQVSLTSPQNGAVAVPFNRMVLVSFSEKMDPLTINNTTFKVTGPGLTAVPGLVTPSGSSATFTPVNTFAASTTYTVTITTGAKDLAGNALASNCRPWRNPSDRNCCFRWCFSYVYPFNPACGKHTLYRHCNKRSYGPGWQLYGC